MRRAAPPPPPPPLSEQPFPNDFPAPTTLEVLDETAPTLSAVRVSRVTRGARVRFRLSEAGRVTIKLTRGNRVVKTRARERAPRGQLGDGARRPRRPLPRRGRRARPLGNPAPSERARVTVPRFGHQLYSPSSTASDGTSRARTRNVSTSRPSATTKPTWNSDSSGSAISTLNVAASTRPALVMTPPVRSSAATTAAFVSRDARRAPRGSGRAGTRCSRRPSATRKMNANCSRRAVAAGLVHHVREDQRADAQREAERQDHGRRSRRAASRSRAAARSG